MASMWDKFFASQWNQNKQYDPLTHGLLEAIAGHDSDRIGDFAHAIGWKWLENEADKNSAQPERAIGRAALTAGAVYGAGAALGAGAGGGGAGAGVGAGEAAGAAGGVGAGEAIGGYGAGNAFGDAAIFGAGGGEAAGGAAAGGLLGDAGYGAGNAFGDEAVFGSQGGLLGDSGYVPWEDGFTSSSANPVPNDPSTGQLGQQLGKFGNSTQQTADKLKREEDARRAEARNSLRNGGELRGNTGKQIDVKPYLYGQYLRPGRKA